MVLTFCNTMRKSTIIAICWPLSLLLATWLSYCFGFKLAVDYAEAEVSNAYTWTFSADLSSIAAQCEDETLRDALSGVINLIQVVRNPEEYHAARDLFVEELKEMQNQRMQEIH